jgi:hypothetical protein
LEKLLELPASIRTDQEFIWLFCGQIETAVRPNRSEIEAGGFFSPEVVDGWIAARPEDFTPACLECWRAFRQHVVLNAAAS